MPAYAYNNYTPIVLDNLSDTSSNITKHLIEQHLLSEIQNILDNFETGGITTINKNILETFINHLKSLLYNILKDKPPVEQEMYLLHIISKTLYEINFTYFNLSYESFRSKILFPNILYILVRFLPKSKSFLQSVIRSIYNEINHHSYGMIQKYVNSYYLSEDIIKNDVLYNFIGNALRKFDPFTINKLQVFYKQIFRNIFFYYLKSEQNVHTQYSSLNEIDTKLSNMANISVRLITYRKALYKLQIEKMCIDSPTLRQVSYNYNIFKKTIFDNEFQNLYCSANADIFMLNNKQYKLLNIYNDELIGNQRLKKIKQLPIIYKLLMCVHINTKSVAYNKQTIQSESVKTAILDEIAFPFKNIFSENHLYPILNKVAVNFTNKILLGEYINLLSLSSVKINQLSFISQLRMFVKICLDLK